MIEPEKYKELYRKESMGGLGSFAIKILVYSWPHMPDLVEVAKTAGVYEAERLLEFELRKAAMLMNPEIKAGIENNRKEMVACFGNEAIYVEEIPNGYMKDDPYYALMPWFVVTTRVGRIKIGWRRRVINIDWVETQGTKTADELFKDEQVTKDARGIHAYSYDDAARYVKCILTGVPHVSTVPA